MKARIILSVLLVLFVVASLAEAQAPSGGLVTKVVVSGNKRIEEDAILRVLETQPGDPYSPEKVSADLRHIYDMGFFEDVQVDVQTAPGGKVVHFIVVEKPAVAQIIFSGNRLIEQEDLAEVVGYPLYSVLDPARIMDSLEAIKTLYREKGYYNAQVTHEVVPLGEQQVAIKYNIQEGGRVYVREIRFEGNEAYDDGDLMDQMESETKGWLAWLTDTGVLKEEVLKEDIGRLTEFYYNHGYIHAQVGQPEIKMEEDGLIVTIQVHEGQQYKMGRLSVSGDLLKPEEELVKELKLPGEKIYSREVLEKDVGALRFMYADEGYAFATVTPQLNERPEEPVVDVNLVVEKKSKVSFGRISISGNQKTRDHVIRRELKVKEGDQFSAEKLRKSNMNLHRLGYFEEVEIVHSPGATPDKMNLSIRVKERPTGTFSVGV
ncbi:MAG: outer membrane protein assembly factor BamA, partial [Thermodesulfobacteriota bacterium]